MSNSQKVKALFDQFAELYAEKYMDQQRYHTNLDRFCELLGAGPKTILEMGCGPGNISRYLLDQRPELEIHGIDLAPNMIELARQYNPEASFAVMDCREIRQLNKPYQGMISGFCLPYLNKSETAQCIADMAAMLLPKGIVYLSLMEDEYENSKWVGSTAGEQQRLFTYFYPAAYLHDRLAENGLTILETIRLGELVNGDTQAKDLVIIAQKH